MSSMNARETFCWWPYGGFFQKIIIFKGHLTKKNANVDTFCQHVGDGKFPKIFRFWCSMTLFRLVIFKARSSYRKHKQTLVVQDNGVLKEGHTAFQLIPGLKKKVHLQLNAFCHSFGVPIPISLSKWPKLAQKWLKIPPGINRLKMASFLLFVFFTFSLRSL